jgi:hypothetical protein
VVIEFNSFVGNPTSGERPPTNGPFVVRFQRGFSFHGELFARCPLDAGAPSGCPRASRYGNGDATIDARPALAEPQRVKIVAFNGKPRNGNDTVLFFVLSDGHTLTSVIAELRRQRTGPFRMALVFDDDPAEDPYTITEFNLRTLRRSVERQQGDRTVQRFLIEAPRRCRGAWAFADVTTLDGERVRATDTAPCVGPAPGR